MVNPSHHSAADGMVPPPTVGAAAKTVAAATSGDRRFFLGTDSAPHAVSAKECACGAAGIFSAPVALPLVAQIFDDTGALDRLEGFVSLNGAAYYGLPPNDDRIVLAKTGPVQAGFIAVEGDAPQQVRVFEPDMPIRWSVVDGVRQV